MRRSSILFFLFSLAALPAIAQTPLPGRNSELLGLRQWTLALIADTLGKYAPGSPLESQHCVGVLLGPLKFPDAAWITYQRGDEGRPSDFTQILVVEPQDSGRVRLTPVRTDTLPLPPAWEDGLALVAQSSEALNYLLGQPWLLADSSTLNPALQRSPVGIHLATFAQSQRTRDGYAFALDAVRRDARRQVRLLALLVLASIPEDDRTWYALAHTLRDADPLVRLVSTRLVTGLSAQASRPVNWAPALEDLAAILDGTNLWAFGPVLRALNATSVDPGLAKGLLKDRAQMLLAALASFDTPTRTHALLLLRHLAGREVGSTEPEWRAWIATL